MSVLAAKGGKAHPLSSFKASERQKPPEAQGFMRSDCRISDLEMLGTVEKREWVQARTCVSCSLQVGREDFTKLRGNLQSFPLFVGAGISRLSMQIVGVCWSCAF